ncbi:General stress protein 69 (YhdN) [hydrothermal vent metagenome]|uniref:General stress protein 69 (YhdN) n=1 Tax=hydrothermal vent metagenome TaxID=652676 RepID=A0A3B1C9X0_9ZZZZ
MEKRELGTSEISVSPIGLGTWGIGGPPFWSERNENESIATIKAALDSGVNLIDTAPVYGFGRSEEVVGKAIDGRRDEVVLATKCGLRWKSQSLKGLYHDLSPSSVTEEIDNSLRRLKTDMIDLYQIHWPDPKTPVERTMERLSAIKEQGKIRAIGVSNFSVGQMKSALEIAPVISLQPKYNMLEREIEKETLPFCRDNNIGVLAYSPLASGLLTGKYDENHKFDGWRGKRNFGVFRKEAFDPAIKIVQKLKDYAESRAIPLLALAIKWAISQPGVTCALVGANSADQVKQNIKALDIRLTRSDYQAIDKIIS